MQQVLKKFFTITVFILLFLVKVHICLPNSLQNKDLTTAIDKINELHGKVEAETSKTDVQKWLNYLRELGTQSAFIEGQESTLDFASAESLANSMIDIIYRITHLEEFWTLQETAGRLSAGGQLIAITEIVSVLMNIHVAASSSQDSYAYSKLPEAFSTVKLNKDIELGDPGVGVFLPLSAVPNGEKMAITAADLHSLRQKMTPLPDDKNLDTTAVIVVKVGSSKENIKLNDPYKVRVLVTSPYRGDISKLNCGYWKAKTNGGGWFTSGCSITSFEQSGSTYANCECDHLTSFSFFHDSLPVNEEEPTTAKPPSIASNPDEVADQIDHILSEITNTEINSTDEWEESLTELTNLISNITLNDEVIANISRPLAHRITNSSLDCLSRLIEAPTNVWLNMSSTEQKSFSSMIFKCVSSLSILMNSKQVENDEPTVFSFSSIQMQSKTFSITESTYILFKFFNVAQIEVPVKAIFEPSTSKIAATGAFLSNISQYLSSKNFLTNSEVISMVVANKQESIHLQHDLKLQFVTKNNFHLVFRDRSVCSFWNLNNDNWSFAGCQLNHRKSNRSSTVCECDHLTNFAALADICNREEPSVTKSILTYLFSSINSLFLVATIIFTLKFNRTSYTLHDDQFKVKTNRFWLNLSVTSWLLVSHLLIIIGMDRTEILEICEISSLVLLYSLLTTFSFCLMLSIHLYLSISKRHLFCYFSYRNFAIFAYIFPLLIIIPSMVVILVVETEGDWLEMLEALTGDYFCWISSSNYPHHIWIFVGPMTIIIVVNFCLLGAFLASLVQLKKNQVLVSVELHEGVRRKESQLVNWYLMVILLFNFGLPWLLYVFYIHEKVAVFFSYFFIVVNGTQGIALFTEQLFIYWSNQPKRKQRSSKRS